MTQQEFTVKATNMIKQMIDIIADKEYEKLASFVRPSWNTKGETLTEAFMEFGEWIDGQLEMWEEYEGRKFVIDHFDESCMEELDFHSLEKQNFTMTTYQPTNQGEDIAEFWFEIAFTIENNEEIIAELNINI